MVVLALMELLVTVVPAYSGISPASVPAIPHARVDYAAQCIQCNPLQRIALNWPDWIAHSIGEGGCKKGGYLKTMVSYSYVK